MNTISEATRRDVFDALTVERFRWWGRLEETSFLARLYDLSTLASTDARFNDAAGDIWQHRVNNDDWEDDWVYHDDRFGLLTGDDEVFLRFLCETLHPIVRPDVTEVQRIAQLINDYLAQDGFELVETTKLGGKPLFTARVRSTTPTPGLSAARTALAGTDPAYIAQQITRMEAAVDKDPDLAIGTAKELIEACCHTILHERAVSCPAGLELPGLVKLTAKTLALTPDDIPEKAKAVEIVRRVLSNLGTIAQGIAELRNLYGTGHGKRAGARGLTSRHAKLAVGAASTLAVFLVETHHVRPPSK